MVRDIASVLENGRFSIDKEWLVSTDTKVDSSKLPHWIGQILLKGVETERVRALNSKIIRPYVSSIPCGLVVRIRRSHRRGRGSIPRMGVFFPLFFILLSSFFLIFLCRLSAPVLLEYFNLPSPPISLPMPAHQTRDWPFSPVLSNCMLKSGQPLWRPQ